VCILAAIALTWDPAKRTKNLARHGLDFARCEEVFAGQTIEFEDDRMDYGERRVVTLGFLDTNLVAIVSTERGPDTRIISMRRATRRERKIYEETI
jgi:uncharacterized DUF497 family protein